MRFCPIDSQALSVFVLGKSTIIHAAILQVSCMAEAYRQSREVDTLCKLIYFHPLSLSSETNSLCSMITNISQLGWTTIQLRAEQISFLKLFNGLARAYFIDKSRKQKIIYRQESEAKPQLRGRFQTDSKQYSLGDDRPYLSKITSLPHHETDDFCNVSYGIDTLL